MKNVLTLLCNIFFQKEYDPNAKKDEPDVESDQGNDKVQDFKPSRDYREKYMKIVGKESGVEAAKITVPNKSFGFGKIFDKIIQYYDIDKYCFL